MYPLIIASIGRTLLPINGSGIFTLPSFHPISENPAFLADALVHEAAHLLTLNVSQIPYDGDTYYYYDETRDMVEGCDQYAVGGGCSLPDSYIDWFCQRFWKDTYAEWWKVDQEAQNLESSEEYWQTLERFYHDQSHLFLTSYAATSVEEVSPQLNVVTEPIFEPTQASDEKVCLVGKVDTNVAMAL